MVGMASHSPPAPQDDEPATPDETLAYFLRRSGRNSFPFRRALVQVRRGRRLAPGPLHLFAQQRRPLALDLFLLHGGLASAAPWDVRVTSMEWARMLDLPPTASSEAAVSRQWRWLAEQKLVAAPRVGRLVAVTRLMEDGSGRKYERPIGGGGGGYFRLPAAYFSRRWHAQLALPGKVALVAALAQAPTFDLPLEQAAKWYGISADTLGRGFVELQDLGLIKVWQRFKKAPNSRYGVTRVNHYALLGEFARAPIEEGE